MIDAFFRKLLASNPNPLSHLDAQLALATAAGTATLSAANIARPSPARERTGSALHTLRVWSPGECCELGDPRAPYAPPRAPYAPPRAPPHTSPHAPPHAPPHARTHAPFFLAAASGESHGPCVSLAQFDEDEAPLACSWLGRSATPTAATTSPGSTLNGSIHSETAASEDNPKARACANCSCGRKDVEYFLMDVW